MLEIGAYEALWTEHNASFRTIAETFRKHHGARPSDLVPESTARELAERVVSKIRQRTAVRFDVRVRGELEYPSRLRDATDPIEMFYFQGDWSLADMQGVAVVGTRKPTEIGIERTRVISRRLAQDGFAVVSGLAEGVDTAAHTAAMEFGGKTIAVIGTPLGQFYPRANADLQDRIAREHLLISPVPVERYDAQNYKTNRFFFPERNKVMSALTVATVIVEAGETSGTLIQAREALRQGRKLMIMASCFGRGLSWPERFLRDGAVKVSDYADVRRQLDR